MQTVVGFLINPELASSFNWISTKIVPASKFNETVDIFLSSSHSGFFYFAFWDLSPEEPWNNLFDDIVYIGTREVYLSHGGSSPSDVRLDGAVEDPGLWTLYWLEQETSFACRRRIYVDFPAGQLGIVEQVIRGFDSRLWKYGFTPPSYDLFEGVLLPYAVERIEMLLASVPAAERLSVSIYATDSRINLLLPGMYDRSVRRTQRYLGAGLLCSVESAESLSSLHERVISSVVLE